MDVLQIKYCFLNVVMLVPDFMHLGCLVCAAFIMPCVVFVTFGMSDWC